MDDLERYDRKGKGGSSARGIFLPLAIACCLLGGGLYWVDRTFAINKGQLPPTPNPLAKVAAPDESGQVRSVQGVISRSSVVPIDREDIDARAEAVTLVNAAAAKAASDGVDKDLNQALGAESRVGAAARPASGEAEARTEGGADLAQLSRDQEVLDPSRYATLDDLVRMQASEEPVLETAAAAASARPDQPVAKKSTQQSTAQPKPKVVKNTAVPLNSRCIIARRELASIRGVLAAGDADDERRNQLAHQEQYFHTEVSRHCR